MNIDLGRYRGLEKAIGEVSSIEGVGVDIHVYPEKYHLVSVGDILLVNSGGYHPIIVVTRSLHRVRRERSFITAGVDHEGMKRVYPDSERLYIYVISGVMVGYIDISGEVSYGLGYSPRVHDFTYILDPEDRGALLMEDSEIDLRLVRRLLEHTSDPLIFREFLIRNRDVIDGLGDVDIVFSELFKIMLDLRIDEGAIGIMVSDFIKIFGGG
jgi:hypothetical protein